MLFMTILVDKGNGFVVKALPFKKVQYFIQSFYLCLLINGIPIEDFLAVYCKHLSIRKGNIYFRVIFW